MIRIHLGRDGLGSVRISALPDLDAELTAAGRVQAQGGPHHDNLLAQVYSRSASPDLAEGVSDRYLSHLFASRTATPFTKALAEGDQRAHQVLDKTIDNLRSNCVEPRQQGIGSAVTARAAGLSHIYVAHGASTLLHRLGHGIRLRPGVVEVPTNFDADLELGGRFLLIQAVALSRRATLAEPARDHLTLRIPAGSPPLPEHSQLAALRSLLGASRAETLHSIATSGGVTGGQLASRLGVSDATASRHAAALRRAGLIRTLRTGQAVKHIATPLGYHLAQHSTTGHQPF